MYNGRPQCAEDLPVDFPDAPATHLKMKTCLIEIRSSAPHDTLPYSVKEVGSPLTGTTSMSQISQGLVSAVRSDCQGAMLLLQVKRE